MNRTLKKITNKCYETDLDYIYLKVGNYSVKRTKELIVHYYYGYPICIVSLISKQFKLDSCGFLGYRLTTSQLNFLEEFYKSKNYKLKGRK